MKKYIPNYQTLLEDKKPSKKVDPTENLTFNLNLTEEEKNTKNQLELPYLSVQSIYLYIFIFIFIYYDIY